MSATAAAFAESGHGIFPGMSTRPRSPAADPMTLGNMHHRTILSAAPWPDHMPVPAFGPRMVCTRCGIIGADTRPNWREQPARLSGVGAAPWQ
jgi:hypothetical protein